MNSKDVRVKIIESATEAFAVYGYDKTTVEDIARMADKAKTSVYYYFAGKADIFAAALREEFRSIREALWPYRDINAETMLPVFKEYLKKRMEVIAGARLYSKLVLKVYSDRSGEDIGIIAKAREDFDEWEKRYFAEICSYGIQAGIYKGKISPDIFAEMLAMLLKGLETQFLLSKDSEATFSTYNEILDLLMK